MLIQGLKTCPLGENIDLVHEKVQADLPLEKFKFQTILKTRKLTLSMQISMLLSIFLFYQFYSQHYFQELHIMHVQPFIEINEKKNMAMLLLCTSNLKKKSYHYTRK